MPDAAVTTPRPHPPSVRIPGEPPGVGAGVGSPSSYPWDKRVGDSRGHQEPQETGPGSPGVLWDQLGPRRAVIFHGHDIRRETRTKDDGFLPKGHPVRPSWEELRKAASLLSPCLHHQHQLCCPRRSPSAGAGACKAAPPRPRLAVVALRFLGPAQPSL